MDLEDELPKRQHVREPPVPVVITRLLDEGRPYEGLLHGWAELPERTGMRGLVTYRREYAPGFWTDVVAWVTSENLRPVEERQQPPSR